MGRYFCNAVLPDRKNAAAVGFRSDEIRRVISVEE
jgi:hypothetical protein